MQKQLEEIIQSPQYDGVNIVVYNVDDYEELGEAISERTDIDLIVMGSHGRQGVKALILGSVAQKVLTHASVPVLIVKG